MFEFTLIVIAFALVLWLVLRHNRKQTEQHDNSFVHQPHSIPTGLTHTSQVSYTGRVRTVSHTGLLQPVLEEEDDDVVDAALVLAQAVYQDTTVVQQDDDQPTFVPGGGDSGGGGASGSWDEPEEVAVSEPQSDPEPDNSPSED